MTAAQYGRIERGDTEPGIITFVRVAQGLQVEPGDLLSGLEDLRRKRGR